MKKSPLEIKIMSKMQPGEITLNGFLGEDRRDLYDIIAEDERTLENLGVSAEDLAKRMQYFTDMSSDSFMDSVEVDGIFEVDTEVVRGKLPCPFSHPGIYRKTITTLTNKKHNITIKWTALNIHLIKEHHFFEGKNSAFRLDPPVLLKALFE